MRYCFHLIERLINPIRRIGRGIPVGPACKQYKYIEAFRYYNVLTKRNSNTGTIQPSESKTR
jgi:hypothetical protein